jgi:parallel beta-helix repeat protein
MRRILSPASKVRVVLLLSLLLSPVALNSVLTGKVFASKTDSQSSTVSINPPFSTVAIGANLTITVDVTNVTDMFVWQVALKYNATVLNLTDIWIPDDNIFANFTQVPPQQPAFGTDAVDGLNYVIYGSSLLGSDNTVNASSSVLLCANFTGLITGVSPITIGTEANPVHLIAGSNSPTDYTFLDDINLVDIPFIDQGGEAIAGSATYLTLTSTTGGTTNPPPGTYVFPSNSQPSINASPELGYDFSNWQLDGANVGSSNPINVTIGSTHHTLQAVFMPHVPVTWTVDWREGANFTSIQDAIDSPSVAYDDIILVKPGVYYENVNMTKELTLKGTDEDTTIIDGNGTGTVVSVYGNLTGFTIIDGEYGVAVRTVKAFYNSTTAGPAISYFEDSAWINQNRIVDNVIGGVTVGTSDQLNSTHATNCTVSNNYVANNNVYGIHIWNAWNNVVVNNTVENNEYGIDFYGDSHNNTLRDNNMIGNEYNFGIILRGESIFSLLNNDVDPSNIVNGKPVYYWINKQNAQVPSDAGYVLLYNCTNISVNDCSLSNNIEGVLAYDSNNTEIGENTIENNAYGIFTAKCQNNTLTGNKLVDNVYGVYLDSLSEYTTMRNNSISGGQFNFGMDPMFELGTTSDIMTGVISDIDKTSLANNIDNSNTLDGKPMIYWINQNDRQVPTNAGFVMLINCTNITVQGLNLTNNLENIVIFASNNTMISNNKLANSVYGIRASSINFYTNSTFVDIQCFYITVKDNTLTNNGVAVELLQAENSTVAGNTLNENPIGILTDSDDGLITRNTINDSIILSPAYPAGLSKNELYVFYHPTSPAWNFAWESLELMQGETGGIIIGGENNTIYDNSVTNCNCSISMDDFLRLSAGRDSMIFHNNFINYTYVLATADYGNKWDDGYPTGGNYWSDSNKTDLYRGPAQNVSGSDGICDNPYLIVTGYLTGYLRAPYDYYPLTTPVSTNTNAPLDFPLIIILAILIILALAAALLTIRIKRKK